MAAKTHLAGFCGQRILQLHKLQVQSLVWRTTDGVQVKRVCAVQQAQSYGIIRYFIPMSVLRTWVKIFQRAYWMDEAPLGGSWKISDSSIFVAEKIRRSTLNIELELRRCKPTRGMAVHQLDQSSNPAAEANGMIGSGTIAERLTWGPCIGPEAHRSMPESSWPSSE